MATSGWGIPPPTLAQTGLTPALNGPGARTCGGPLEPRFSLIHFTPLHTVTNTLLEYPMVVRMSIEFMTTTLFCNFSE